MRSAELGSFAAAGRALGISAAAVGQNVKRLEDDYGIKLFNRTTRKMSLTPEGSLLFQRARQPLRALDEIDHLFTESQGMVSGPLRITAPKRFAYHSLMPLVAEFCASHPALEIDVDASDAIRDLISDPVDVAFRISAPSDSTMIARPLMDLPVYTMASPAYLADRPRPKHPQDLVDHTCLQYRYAGSSEKWRWAFNINGEVERFEIPGVHVFNDPEVLLAAGTAGMGVFQMDGLHAQDGVAAGQLTLVMPEYAAQLQGLYLCYPSRENQPLRLRAFVEFILHRMKRCSFTLTDEPGLESG